MAAVLQQALRGLCYKSGWAYAVFWKLKRRSRMVLTWEDGFYEFSKAAAIPDFSSLSNGVGAEADVPQDVSGSGDEIGLAVARMSYHVYSLGEGIIGRVAFTGKHQWVFGERSGDGNGPGRSGRVINEKYPAGWQQQFAAGIKTIAVVAVPQGVVQLGSTQMVMEDLTLVGHVRAIFGTLQSVPGAFLSDYVSDSQGGRAATGNPAMMPLPVATSGVLPEAMSKVNFHQMRLSQMTSNGMAKVPKVPAGSYDMMNMFKPGLQAISSYSNPCVPAAMNPSNPLSLRNTRIKPGTLANKDVSSGSHSLLSTVSLAVGNRQGVLSSPLSRLRPQATAPSQSCVNVADNVSLNPPLSSLRPTPPLSCVNVADKGSMTLLSSRCRSSANIATALQQRNAGSLFERMLRADPENQLAAKPPVSTSSVIPNPLLSTPFKKNDYGCGDRAIPYRQDMCVRPDLCNSETAAECIPRGLESDDNFTNAKVTVQEGPMYSKIGNGQFLQSGRSSASVGRSVNIESNVPSARMLTLQRANGHASNVAMWPDIRQNLLSADAFSSAYIPDVPVRQEAAFIQPRREERMAVKDLSRCVEARLSTGDLGALRGHGDMSLTEKYATKSPQDRKLLNGMRVLEGGCEKLSDSVKNQWDCFFWATHPLRMGDELSQVLRTPITKENDVAGAGNLRPFYVRPDNNKGTAVLADGDSSAGISPEVENHSVTVDSDYDIFKAVSNAVLIDARPEPLLDAVVAGVSCTPRPTVQPPPSFENMSRLPKVSTFSVEDTSTLVAAKESLQPGKPDGRGLPSSAADVRPACKRDNDVQTRALVATDAQLREISRNQALVVAGNEKANVEGEVDRVQGVRKAEESGRGGSSRKKPRLGDSARPRPKDRQQIQDRVKELREIVPNTCKCSIDSLLEKTIKHMDFLQSVTLQGGKWKNLVEYKGVNGDLKNGTSLLSSNQNNSCPIVVESLNEPRQMLVEMTCEERGLFLEIADAVRGLGLTILKGVMETRSGKTWARFVVEAASREIHRVEVLWNLMQLLKPESRVQDCYDGLFNLSDSCVFDEDLDTPSGLPSISYGLQTAPLHMVANSVT